MVTFNSVNRTENAEVNDLRESKMLNEKIKK